MSGTRKDRVVRFDLIWRNGEYKVSAPNIDSMEVVEATAYDDIRQENADLKTRVAELFEALEALESCIMETRGPDARQALEKARAALSRPTTGTATLLRETHYRECAEIAEDIKTSLGDESYVRGCLDTSAAILQKLEKK